MFEFDLKKKKSEKPELFEGMNQKTERNIEEALNDFVAFLNAMSRED